MTEGPKCGSVEAPSPVPLSVVGWIRDCDNARMAELNAELRRCIAVMDCAIVELIAAKNHVGNAFYNRALRVLREQRERARKTSEGTHAENAGTEKDVCRPTQED